MAAHLPDRVDVVVVGAGYAGLATAAALRAGGASVAVLEARDRVGGRAWTRDVGGGRFDLGGQWLGAGQRRLAALAARHGVTAYPQYALGEKILDDGHRVARYRGTIPALRPLELVELHLALRRIDKLTARVSALDPASSPDAAALDDRTVAEHARRIRSRRVREVLATALGSIFGVEPAEMSLLYFLAYLRAGGGLMKLCDIEGGAQEQRFEGGTGGLAARWAAELDAPIVTGAPVRRIDHGGAEVAVTSDRGSVAARRVVLAIPPPLVAQIALDPAGPAARDQLVQRSAMGALVKVIATYDDPFWRERGLSGEAVALRAAPAAVAFDNCSPGGPPALLAFVQAEAARRWTDGAADAVVGQLARWFGDEARTPTAVAFVDWAAEPWSRGCPTAVLSPRALTSSGTTLRAPIGRIHFAGTETATEWTGYFEGALESGERAAREVLRAL